MTARLTDEEKIEKLENTKFIFVESNEDSKTNVIVCDRDGYYYDVSLYSLINGGNPDFVNRGNPYSLYNMNLWIENNNKEFSLCKDNVYTDSKTKLKFLCHKCNDIFIVDWNHIHGGHGCSLCQGHHMVNENNCLAVVNPELMDEWSPNNNISPYEIKSGSAKKALWICSECGYEWEAVIATRTRLKCGCPACIGRVATKENNFSISFPELLSDWDFKKNDNPENFTPYSNKKVCWKCHVCGYEWVATIGNRTGRGDGCKNCSGRVLTSKHNLAFTRPKLLEDWNYVENGNPENYTPSSAQVVCWICNKCNHNWKSSIGNRAKGQGCPACAGRIVTKNRNLATEYPYLLDEWDYDSNGNPEDYMPVTRTLVWWICSKCNNRWQVDICQRTKSKAGCPRCASSLGEVRIRAFLKINNLIWDEQVKFDGCHYINSLNFDFYLPDYSIAVEYQGQQHFKPIDFAGKGKEWAKEEFDKNIIRDSIKRQFCQDNNIPLLEISYLDFNRIEEILSDYLGL